MCPLRGQRAEEQECPVHSREPAPLGNSCISGQAPATEDSGREEAGDAHIHTHTLQHGLTSAIVKAGYRRCRAGNIQRGTIGSAGKRHEEGGKNFKKGSFSWATKSQTVQVTGSAWRSRTWGNGKDCGVAGFKARRGMGGEPGKVRWGIFF